jgi:hypothetical protein
MKERVLPLDRKVETRGVDRLGNVTAPGKSDVNVIVQGVRVFKVGEGGKTNNVWEGVEAAEVDSTTSTDALRNTLLRRRSGGGTRRRDSTRWLADGIITCEFGRAVTKSSAAVGEDGTGRRTHRFTGRFFCLGGQVGSWKVERIAVIGGRLVGIEAN